MASDPWRNLNVHQFPGGEFHGLGTWDNHGLNDEEYSEQIAAKDSATGGFDGEAFFGKEYEHHKTLPLPKLDINAIHNGEWRN